MFITSQNAADSLYTFSLRSGEPILNSIRLGICPFLSEKSPFSPLSSASFPIMEYNLDRLSLVQATVLLVENTVRARQTSLPTRSECLSPDTALLPGNDSCNWSMSLEYKPHNCNNWYGCPNSGLPTVLHCLPCIYIWIRIRSPHCDSGIDIRTGKAYLPHS